MSQTSDPKPTASANDQPTMVEFRGVTKRFGSFTAVQDVSLHIRRGEFLTLLGPSGCGKTTLLRMISGFEIPSEGVVLLDGVDVTRVPPYRRNVNQVFQSYALFPHLSVRDNIGFGLRMQKISRPELDQRVEEGVELVSLKGFEERKPSQLSGGQRQRVALARAVVCRPKVLLLDEPLSALDAKLRHAMQIELKRLQQKLGITFVFVTHDQEEALTMSDRIAVCNKGKIEQLGSADEIYYQPKTTFVANFIGEANILEAKIVGRDDSSVQVRLDDDIALTIDPPNISINATDVLISIRPEKIALSKTPLPGDNLFQAEVAEELFMGAMDQLLLRTKSGLELTAVVANESATQDAFHIGDHVFCRLHRRDVVIVQGE